MKDLLASLVSWGPWGLCVAAFLDGAGLPIPGGVDVLILFLASRLPEQVVWLAILAVIGSVAGNFLLFAIARRGGQAFLDRRSASKRSTRFRRWFDRFGLLTVFVSALVPLPVMPMKIFVISSGALGSRPVRFLLVFLAARIPRYLGLAILGGAMGTNALGFLRQNAWYLFALAAALFVLLTALVRYMEKRAAASA